MYWCHPGPRRCRQCARIREAERVVVGPASQVLHSGEGHIIEGAGITAGDVPYVPGMASGPSKLLVPSRR